jgi:GNAT superfamily N-acetyltransferase
VEISARSAGAADLAPLVVLAEAARAAVAEVRGGPLLARHEAQRHPLAEWLGEVLASPGWHAAVATLDGVVLGYAAVESRTLADGGRLGIIHDLYVDPGARGVGLGEALMAEVERWCTERGCLGLDSVALPGDRATKNFFEANGMVARAIVVHKALAPGAA